MPGMDPPPPRQRRATRTSRELKVSQFVGKGASTVQRSSGTLIGKEVFREEELEGAARLGFEDPFSLKGLVRLRPRQPDLLLP
jgi:hypothetical protein